MTIRDEATESPLFNLAEITEIELLILRRLQEVTMGEHRSTSHGSGFDFVGLRTWQPGDRFSHIDWAQSSLTNFSPTIVREFEQPSTATVVVIADRSASTRCGVSGVSIGHGIARALAVFGMSAVFFQDPFGLITFEGSLEEMRALRPRIGRKHVIHCLDAYQFGRALQPLRAVDGFSQTIGSFLRRAALIPVVSDFLFDDPDTFIRELALLNATHDVFVTLVDAAFAFAVPPMSAGWIDIADVETGRTQIVSRKNLAAMMERVRQWQDDVAYRLRDAGLDVVRVGGNAVESDLALAEFVGERRLRKVA